MLSACAPSSLETPAQAVTEVDTAWGNIENAPSSDQQLLWETGPGSQIDQLMNKTTVSSGLPFEGRLGLERHIELYMLPQTQWPIWALVYAWTGSNLSNAWVTLWEKKASDKNWQRYAYMPALTPDMFTAPSPAPSAPVSPVSTPSPTSSAFPVLPSLALQNSYAETADGAYSIPPDQLAIALAKHITTADQNGGIGLDDGIAPYPGTDTEGPAIHDAYNQTGGQAQITFSPEKSWWAWKSDNGYALAIVAVDVTATITPANNQKCFTGPVPGSSSTSLQKFTLQRIVLATLFLPPSGKGEAHVVASFSGPTGGIDTPCPK